MVLYLSSQRYGLDLRAVRKHGLHQNFICEGGGTGRRARLRCVWFILGGSSPLPRTKNQYTLCAGFSFCAREGISNKAAAFMPQAKPQCNNDDRSLRLKQGGVVGAAFCFFKAPSRGCGKISKRNPQGPAAQCRKQSAQRAVA